MFDIFKPRVATDVAVVDNNSKYSPEIQEIHNEFYTASDKAIEFVNDLFKQAEKDDVKKGLLLESLGFVQAKQVKNAKETEEKLGLTEGALKWIKIYKKKYPNCKFISEEQVKEICRKYGLVCGDVSFYTGFVPSENVKAIANFKISDSDKDIIIASKNIGSSARKIGEIVYDNGGLTSDYTSLYKRVKIPKGFVICAPVKDMKLPDKDSNEYELVITDGYRIFAKHIPDPVVLQPVKGGYLIVTAWGDEASDPVLQND